MNMNKFVKSVIVLLLLSFALVAQEGNDYVNKFYKMVRDNTPKEKNSLSKENVLTENEILEFRDLLFNAVESDPIGFKKSMLNWHQEWIKEGIPGIKAPESIKPGIRINMIKEKISKIFDDEYVELLETPFVLKVKITNIVDSLYETEKKVGRRKKALTSDLIVLYVEIENILKGTKYFEVGEKIRIGYLPWWYNDSPITPVVGESYLIPLQTWTRELNSLNYLTIKHFKGSIISKVEENKIVCPFGQNRGTTMNWNEFLEYFQLNFILTKR